MGLNFILSAEVRINCLVNAFFVNVLMSGSYIIVVFKMDAYP